MTAYTIPNTPPDPETAALELIVRLPADLLGHGSPSAREALQDFTALLSAEGAFAGMTWHDAKAAAVAIAFDATNRDNAAEFLWHRAYLTSSDADNAHWDNRDAMVRAFNIAAGILDPTVAGAR